MTKDALTITRIRDRTATLSSTTADPRLCFAMLPLLSVVGGAERTSPAWVLSREVSRTSLWMGPESDWGMVWLAPLPRCRIRRRLLVATFTQHLLLLWGTMTTPQVPRWTVSVSVFGRRQMELQLRLLRLGGR